MRRLAALLAMMVAAPSWAAIALDTSSKHRNTSSAATCLPGSLTTTGGAGEIVVVMAEADGTVASPTISDTASMSWTQIGLRNDSSGAGDAFMDVAWYTTTSGNLSADAITVGGGSHGWSCAAWAFTGAGTPTSWTTGIQGSPSQEALTITAGTGSWLVGISQDNTTGSNLTAIANTTLTQGSCTASNWCLAWETKTSISGSTQFGSTKTADNYASAAVEVPAGGGGGGGATLHTLTTMGVGQ